MPNIPRARTAGEACGMKRVAKSSWPRVSFPENESFSVERCAEPLRYDIQFIAQTRGESQMVRWSRGSITGFCKAVYSPAFLVVFTGLVGVVCTRTSPDTLWPS